MINLDYLYKPAAAKKYFVNDYFVDKKLGFQVIEHGTILPYKGKGGLSDTFGGIIDESGGFVKDTYLFTGDRSYAIPKESIMYSSETVVYLGMFFHVWGHNITDEIRYLWFLKSEEFKTQFKDCPLVYIAVKGKGIDNQKNFRRLLEILEVDITKLLLIEQPTCFNKVILPDQSFYFYGKGFTREYCETINRIRNFALKNRTPTSSKKIYYFYGRNQFGEERIAEYFKSKGYAVISPEKLTCDEQLNWLINAECFASTVGSCSHNSVFLRDGMEAIFIPRLQGGSAAFSGYQGTLNQVNSLNASYIDCSLSIFSKGLSHGAYCFIISEQLKRFFGDKLDGYDSEDFKIFLQYVKNSISKGFIINLNAKKAYGAIFTDFMAQLKQREDLTATCNMPPNWESFQPAVFCYQTHIADKGWGTWSDENAISNDIEQKRQIEAIKINSPAHKIYYSVYWNDKEGWSAEVTNGEQAGTTGKKKPIIGIKIRLDEAGAKEFDILYRVHKFDGSWSDWAKNGEVIYSHGQKLNAVQIKLETKT